MRLHLNKEDYLRVTITATDREAAKAEDLIGFLEDNYGYIFNKVPQYLGGVEYRCFCETYRDFINFKERYEDAKDLLNVVRTWRA